VYLYKNLGHSHTFKADIGLLIFARIFRTSSEPGFFWGWQNRGRGGAMLTQQTGFYFWGSYVWANFGKNRSRNATTRVGTDGYTGTLTDANQFYYLSHGIRYSYEADNK